MLTTLKPAAEKALKPVAYIFKDVNPNTITALGLVFPVLFFIFLVKGWYLLALLAIILSALDMVDGMVARAQNKVTAFGGLLDSTIDRFADFTMLAAFGFAGLVPWEVVMPVILLTYLISYIRSRTELAAKGNLVASVGIMERTERLILLSVGIVLYALFPNSMIFEHNILVSIFIVLGVLSAVTVGQRMVFASQKLS